MLEAIFAAAMFDDGAHEQGEQDGGDHRLLLRREGEGTHKRNQPVAPWGAVLTLAHT